jgi:hypothetical protein
LLAFDHARLGAAAGRLVIRRKPEPAAVKKRPPTEAVLC